MLIVVTGGSGSGKSAYAEEQVMAFGERQRVYVATMFPFDEESHKRIERHRRMRAHKKFETLECYTGLARVKLSGTIQAYSAQEEHCPGNRRKTEKPVVLLECLSNLTANEMFQEGGAGENTVEAVLRGVLSLEEQAFALVVVTNEIFSEAALYEGDTRRYQNYLGKINQELARRADRAVEVVYGIPVKLKKDSERLCRLEALGGRRDEEILGEL
ncbi:MAG: bifunctional adenosylcobinamide kinase/adenosylcobinamide-phosphate guanylyltransferase [Eubacteriales bacterium]|nr:bifunctional adenosylcobinamide kinase/adenosylcobinamide-phosphate guanylyltransferase [Eubacteriales bacterium]